MEIRYHITDSWVDEFEDDLIGGDDESIFHWYGADNSNLDGLDWRGGTCLELTGHYYTGWRTIDEGGDDQAGTHPTYSLFTQQYGTTDVNVPSSVPQYLQLRGKYHGDDCIGGSDCGYDTGFWTCGADNDDYGYDDVLTTTLNYRFGAPNQYNYTNRYTTNHGSSDYGAETRTRWTSPIPDNAGVDANIICSGTSTTLHSGGTVSGGQLKWYVGTTLVGTGNDLVVSPTVATTYRVYNSNGGTNSQCWKEISVTVINCTPGCFQETFDQGGPVSVDGDEVELPPVAFDISDGIPAGSVISDVNVEISWTKSGSSCLSDDGSNPYSEEVGFVLISPNTGACASTSLVQPGTYSGSADIGNVNTLFDEDVGTAPTGTPASGTFNPIGNLDNCIGESPFGLWTIEAQDNSNHDPLCVLTYTIELCTCVPATAGTGASVSPTNGCSSVPTDITLTLTGGSGDEIRWFTGSCGGTQVGTGNNLTVTAPATPGVYTYYGAWWTAEDGCLLSACQQVTFTVSDAVPIIACPSDVVLATEPDLCGATLSYITPVGTDECPGAVTVQTGGLGSGSLFPVGTTTEIYQVTDSDSQTSTCSFNVTVNDTENPTIICPSDQTLNNDSGNCSAVATFADATATDNCSGGGGGGSLLAAGTPTINLPTTYGGVGAASGVAYNPNVDRYYTVVAGGTSLPADCFDGITGAFISTTTTGFDYRGIWWNPGLNQPEGNGFSANGVDVAGLSSDCLSGTTTNVLAANQPNSQSCGDLDYDNNEIIYYNSGNIRRVDRATGLTIATLGLTGTPGGSSYAGNSVGYTGVAGMEYALYDLSSQSVHLYDRSTGAYAGTSSLGLSTSSFGFAYENDQAWIFNTSTHEWHGFNIGFASGGGSISVAHTGGLTTGSAFPVGFNTVTFTATDGVGNTLDCNLTVTVNDTENPASVCSDFTANLTVTDDVTVLPGNVDGGSTDNCAITGQTIVPNTFDCDDLGTTVTVTLTNTDDVGNSSSCTANVTIADPNSYCCALPTASCQNIDVYLDATGNATIAAADIDGGSTADCGLLLLMASPTSFTCDDLGSASSTLTITDVNEASANCTATLTVLDTISPTITCPADIVVNNDAGLCSTVVLYDDATATDNCGGGGSGIPAGAIALEYQQSGAGLDLNARLTTMGFTVTSATGSLATLIPSQPWDLVVLQAHGDPLSSGDITAIQTYLAGGGKLIFNYWTLESHASLQASLNVASAVAYASPLDIHPWDAGHPIFNSPNTITNLNWATDLGFGLEGDRMEPDGGGTAVAGFTPTPTTGEAAIVIGNSGSSIANGFTAEYYDIPEITNFFENEVAFLFGGGASEPLAAAVPTITLDASGGTDHRSGVLYNPVENRYYSALSGTSSFPINCFDGTTGALVGSPTSGFDYRGIWWNPGIGQPEGNGYGSAPVVSIGLSGPCPSGTTTTIQASNQPDDQSCGDLDYDDNDIIYYFSGTVRRVNRATGATNSTLTLTGIPGGTNYTWRNISYTGEIGYEYAIYDRASQEIHLYDKSSGAFSGSIFIGLATSSSLGYGFSYANDQAWIYSGDVWNGFTIFGVSSGSVSALADIPSGSTFPLGDNTVTFTGTDDSGNTGSCSFTVTVEDTENPVALCNDLTVYLDGSGSASVTTGDVNAGSTDNCSVDALSLGGGEGTFDCTNAGANTVTLTVTDAAGNSASCVSNITVEDIISPQITCPGDITIDNDPGECFATVTYVEPFGTDNCAG
ncbi:MAG: HYR domain-containing protein, partial [Bacteroidetes bacterium]|nr:HYR domain-containing protein [Bacteroidota bacterium]